MAKQIDEMKIRHLAPKIRILWALNAVVLAFLMWLLVSWLSQLAFPDDFLGVSSAVYPFMFFMLIGIFMIPYLVWVELKYRNYTYYIADTEMIIRRGVLRIERIAIPFEKVQNVNVSRSILERLLGLATLKIETAGTNPGEAEGVIPGVGNYHEAVDEILEHVEHARPKEAGGQEEKEKEFGMEMEAAVKEIASLRDELHRLREEMKKLKEEKAGGKNSEPKEPPAEPAAPGLEFEGERYKKSEEKGVSPRKTKKDRK